MQTYGVYFADSLRLWCFLYLPIGPEETEICLPNKMIMELKDQKLESLTDVVPLAHNMAKKQMPIQFAGRKTTPELARLPVIVLKKDAIFLSNCGWHFNGEFTY